MTIREGEDTADVVFSPEAKLKIIRNLDEIGIPEIELGYLGAIDEQYRFAKSIEREGINAKIGSHNRAYTKENEWKDEIDRAVDAGADIITFIGWVSDVTLRGMPWIKKEDIPERIAKCVEYAKGQGIQTCVGVGLSPSALDLTVRCWILAEQAGADRFSVGSGTGATRPEALSFMVGFLRNVIGPRPEIALHCHNDFGLATALTLEGIKAGAGIADVAVNGLGHNSGIAALEEVVVCLSVLYGVETGVSMDRLCELSKLVEDLSGVSLSPNKSVVGKNFYRHQLDSHIASILRGDNYSWENIAPEALGRKRTLEWMSGRFRRGKSGSIMAKIEQMGLKVDDDQFNAVSQAVQDAIERKRLLSENEVEEIIRHFLRFSLSK